MSHGNYVDRNKTAKQRMERDKINSMPMNKDFLLAKNQDGTPKYPLVAKIWQYKMMNLEEIQDIMRQVVSYISQIKHHENRIVRLNEQQAGEVIERDPSGRLYSKEEIQLLVMSEKIAIPRDLTQIREFLIDKLMPKMDGITFKAEDYNSFVLSTEEKLKSMGYTLLPQKPEFIIPSEL